MTRLDRHRFVRALFPRDWRERYGDEMLDLADDTGWTTRTLVDLLRCAIGVRARHHAVGLSQLAGLVTFVVVEALAYSTGMTDNMFWWPRTVGSGVVLVAVIGALAAVWWPVGRWAGRRLRGTA